MKPFLLVIAAALVAGILGAPLTLLGATYFIRPDGGTAAQCTGETDAPYPGAGTGQPCAWSHPFWALDASGRWKIQGGDTLIIHKGSYPMGLGAPNTDWCEAEWSWECHLPPLPSGPDASHPTRILGVGWDQGCPDPPELWGTERPWQILDLTQSSHVEIACLELTDHSECVEFHANPEVRCPRESPPFGPWAPVGIRASDSSDVTLSDLNIHGFAHTGVHAGRLSDWRVQRVRIAGNGWVGWDGDVEGDDSNSGTLSFQGVVIEWNGCAEGYPSQEPFQCWAQTAGGYGDGLGTGTTGGQWIFEDCIFRYNTSDGLDLLYARNPDSHILIRRTQAYGNAGNQIKTNGPTKVENSLMVGNCGFFEGADFTYHVDPCRAGGGALSLSLRRGAHVSVVNCTVAGEGDCLLTVECDTGDCDGTEVVTVQNNIFRGYPEFLSAGDTACYVWLDRNNFYQTLFDYNVIYAAKIGVLGYEPHDIADDPLLLNDQLDSFDAHLLPNSPAIDTGLGVGSLGGLVPGDDLEGESRPQGDGVDRGCLESPQAPSPPSATTLDATEVGTSNAVLNASVNPMGSPTRVWFQWGVDDAYGQTSDARESPLGGSGEQQATALIRGFWPSTTYHFRVVAENPAGTAFGQDHTFTTQDMETLFVSPTDPGCGGNLPCYSSIQEATDAAGPECVIRIQEGDYPERLSLTDSKTIILEGGWNPGFTARGAPSSAHALTVSGGAVIIRDLEL